LRQVGDAGAAEEITQNVFVALAQAAGKLGSHPTIAGWLHQTALNKSREWLRSELRRRKREQVAVNLETARAEGDSVWSPLVPLLDEALLKLREPDRQAVILHFMEGQTFQEVGSALGVGEDTARKRVNRCLNELTDFFRRRGFAVPALAAGAPLFALSSHAAPAGLAASATTAGLAAAHSAASASTLTLIKGALKIMAWTKAKTAIGIGAAAILATGTAITISEIAAPSGTDAERAPVVMQTQWQIGKKYLMHKEDVQTTEMKNPGQAKPVKQVQKLSQDLYYFPIRKLDNDGWQLQLELGSLALVVTNGDRKVFAADSTQNPAQDARNPVGARLRKMTGARMEYFTDANGKVEQMNGYQELVTRVAGNNQHEQAAFKDMFSEINLEKYGSVLEDTVPRRVVKLGDRWTMKLKVPSNGGNLNLDIKCVFKNWEQRAAHKCMHITYTGSISAEAGPDAPALRVKIEKGKISGDVWFDPESEMLVESAEDVNAQLKINQKGQILTVPLNEKTRVTLLAVEDV